MNANRLRSALLPLLIIITIVFSANVFAEDLPRLFAPVKTADARENSLSVSTDTVYVNVDLPMLKESGTAPTRLKASVPGKTLVLIKRTSQERTTENYTWTGTVEGDDVSTVVMTVVGGILNGTISTADDSYSIVPANGAYAVVRKDPSLSVRNPDDERIPRIVEDADSYRNDSLSRSAQQEDGSRIDFLVLYTQKMQ
ncbi:MAG: hypothetical protein HQL08_11450, partial [Nitrospirae bacterium]|nr:hypothetical protein [Nitrospirota bacterium]